MTGRIKMNTAFNSGCHVISFLVLILDGFFCGTTLLQHLRNVFTINIITQHLIRKASP
jgi:hypothetical protein